jgi:hypothetical protein
MSLETLKAISLDTKLDEIATDQTKYFDKEKKYKQVWPTEEDGMTKEIHEYVGPKGFGYVVIYKKKEDEKEFIKTIGYGVEAKERTSDWSEIKDELIKI